jgi:hypothetical protein
MRQAQQRVSKPLRERPLRLRGFLEYELRNARTNEVVRRGKTKNVVTAIGRGYALKQIIAGAQTANLIQWMMLGTDASATASNSTALGGYFSIINSTRATTATTTATNSACTFTLAASWNSTETHASSTNPGISEFALLNSSATGASMTMFNRVTTSAAIVFTTSNTLAVTITITN